FTPDGQLVFVSTLSGPDVTVLRSLTGSVVKRVPVGHGADGIVIQPDGARAYVACTPDDSVAVIDVRSLTVVGRIGAGGRPDGLAWGAYRTFKFAELANQMRALPGSGWRALGVLEMVGAVLLIVPAAARWMPVLTPLAAAALALETLALAGLYARYSLKLAATNP